MIVVDRPAQLNPDLRLGLLKDNNSENRKMSAAAFIYLVFNVLLTTVDTHWPARSVIVSKECSIISPYRMRSLNRFQPGLQHGI